MKTWPLIITAGATIGALWLVRSRLEEPLSLLSDAPVEAPARRSAADHSSVRMPEEKITPDVVAKVDVLDQLAAEILQSHGELSPDLYKAVQAEAVARPAVVGQKLLKLTEAIDGLHRIGMLIGFSAARMSGEDLALLLAEVDKAGQSPRRDQVLKAIASTLQPSRGQEALDLTMNIGDKSVADEAAGEVLSRWVQYNYQDAQSLLPQIAAFGYESAQAKSFIRTWIHADPAASASWLLSVEDSSLKVQYSPEVAQAALVAADYVSAREWAGRMSDEVERNDILARIARSEAGKTGGTAGEEKPRKSQIPEHGQ